MVLANRWLVHRDGTTSWGGGPAKPNATSAHTGRMQFPALTQENKNPPCPSVLSVTIDFYRHLDPPLIRRSSAAEVVIIFVRMTNAQRTMDTLNFLYTYFRGKLAKFGIADGFDWLWSGGPDIFGICGNPCTGAFIFLTERKKEQKHELTEKENMQEQSRQCKKKKQQIFYSYISRDTQS